MDNPVLLPDEPLSPSKRKLMVAFGEIEETFIAGLREIAAKDLFKFNRFILEAETGGEDFVPLAPFHEQMCHFVQDGRDKKKLLLIPRNHLKTKLISVGYSLFRIAEDPSVRILIYSATWQMAVDILSQIQRALVAKERFIELFGAYQPTSQVWAQDRIRLATSNKREPTVTAAGIDNNLVGGHYDLIIFDDVVNRDNIGTGDQIQKVIRRYNDSLDLLEPKGQVIVIGTRWHDSDLYGWILDADNNVLPTFDTLVMKAYEGNLETDESFQTIWPGKFNRKVLLDRLNSEGWSHFSAQYLNNPVPEESAVFKRNWFLYAEPEELKGKLLSRFMAIDPAISQEKTADFTAMVVAGVDQWGFIYILDITRAKLSPNEIINEIFRLQSRWQLSSIAIETVAYQKTLAYSLRDEMKRRNTYFHITELKPSNRTKDERIKGLQPLYENGKIIHNKYLYNNYFLEDELVRYPAATHDDCIDAFSYLLDIIYPARQKVTPKTGRKYLY